VTGEVRRLAAGVFGFLAPGFGALVDFDALAGFDVFLFGAPSKTPRTRVAIRKSVKKSLVEAIVEAVVEAVAVLEVVVEVVRNFQTSFNMCHCPNFTEFFAMI